MASGADIASACKVLLHVLSIDVRRKTMLFNNTAKILIVVTPDSVQYANMSTFLFIILLI